MERFADKATLAAAAQRGYIGTMSAFARAMRLPLFAPLLLTLAGPVVGQVAPATSPVSMEGVDTSPWLYKNSDIPHDPDWHFGTLPNGLRYAVRRNGVPPGQVAVRVRVDVGSLNEQDSEQGFAHFIEHLSFRGSKYIADGEAKRTWQRLGATFGSDTNAQTTPTQTVYKLDLPSATRAGLDESLHALSGMMQAPNIVANTIDTERPVVLAEQREQPGPQVTFGDALRSTFFAGQPLADRSPIGTIKTLEAATPASVKAFHDRWYRPTRTVVILSGDMDPAVLAQMVVKNFAEWKPIGPDPAEPDFGKPDPTKPSAGSVVAAGLPSVVSMGVMRPWHFNNDTAIFNQKRMVDQIAVRVINRRLEARARAGGSFLQANVDLDDVSRSANVTSVNIVPIGANWEAALKDVRAVIADAQARAPSQAEINRELADFDTAMRQEVETSRVEMGATQADTMVGALDIRETTTTPQISYDIFKDARTKGMFTPASVLASSKAVFQGTATRALVNTPTPDPTITAKLETAMKADVGKLTGKRAVQAAVDFSRLPSLGKPGTVASRTPIGGNTENIAFANGVHLLVYPNSADTGRVYVQVRFGGGYNAIPADKPSPVWAAELALVASGVGKLDQNDLDSLISGRRISLDFDIGEDAFSLAAMTSAVDLPDQLKLMADKLAVPAWDPEPVQRAKAVVEAGYASLGASPDGVLSRDLDGLLRDGDPRWVTPSRQTVEATTPQAFRAFWDPRLKSGPIEVSVFGDVSAQAAIDAVAKTFGAMAPRPAVKSMPPPVRFPAHNATPVIRTHSGGDNQAAAVIAWPTGSGVAGLPVSRRLEILAAIFSDRLFERLRNATGASYSPSVQSQWPIGLPGGGRFVAIGQVPPDKVGFFFTLSRQIAAELVSTPVGADELQRTLAPMKQALLRAATSSAFWLQKLSGSSQDPARIDDLKMLASDYAGITPAELQEVAAHYLRPDKDWTMEVLPQSVAAKAGGAAKVTAAR